MWSMNNTMLAPRPCLSSTSGIFLTNYTTTRSILTTTSNHIPFISLSSSSCRKEMSVVQLGSRRWRATSGAIDTDVDASMDVVQRRLMFQDECILVDEHDNVVGHDSKYNCHQMEKIEKENMLHRSFSVFLFNSKYELLLHQRSPTKVTFPLVWTNTCCSHPLYIQSELIEHNYLGVRNAAQRKMVDELGILLEELPIDEFTLLGRIIYKAPFDGKWGEHELDYLLFIVRDVDVQPNPDEVADVKYFNRDEIKELIKRADKGEVKLSPWFRLIADNLLMNWWDHVQNGTMHDVADLKTIHKLS